MSNMFKDALNVMSGKDLEENPKPRRVKFSTKKAEKAAPEPKKKEEREPAAGENARFKAFAYACKGEKLSEDIQKSLMTGEMSDDLRDLLEVLCDKPVVREMLLAQGDVRPVAPAPDKIELVYKFIHEGEEEDCTDEAKKLIEMGKTVDELEAFNLLLVVSKKNTINGEIIGDGDDADYAEIKQQLEQKKDN